nr:hypothetical protein [Tanacetum cinerariifolium]
MGKQYHIKRQKELRDKPAEVYSKSKIIEVIKTSYELGYEPKFIIEIMDYKEIGFLGSLSIFIRSTVIWDRVHDFQLGMKSYQQKVNLTAPTITFHDIKREKLFTITSEDVIGMIYENNKKKKRVMIHKEIHKFCDLNLKKALEKLKKYNKDVKYGYVVPIPSDAHVEYLQFYEEDIKDRLKHLDQMRRWEMYMNGRPLGSRRDCAE